MRCFTFKSLKSLKAPGLDGVDTGLLNLPWERKQDWGRVGAGRRKKPREEQRWELSLAWFNPALAMARRLCLAIAVSGFCPSIPGRSPRKEAQRARLGCVASQEFTCHFCRISWSSLRGNEPRVWGPIVIFHPLKLSVGQRRPLTYFTTQLWGESLQDPGRRDLREGWDATKYEMREDALSLCYLP